MRISYIYIYECLDCNKYLGVELNIDDSEEDMRLYQKLEQFRSQVIKECIYCNNHKNFAEISMPVRHLREGNPLIEEHNNFISTAKQI